MNCGEKKEKAKWGGEKNVVDMLLLVLSIVLATYH